MTTFQVTPEQLQSTSARVRSGASSIDGELAALAAAVGPLSSVWTGVAQARFAELWAEWQRSAAGLREALEGIATLLATAGQNYADAESTNLRMFS